MKTLPELLRDADPLGDEPGRSSQQRRVSRQLILDSPHVADTGLRRPAMVAAIVLTLVGVTGIVRYWSPGAVDVVAAVRFEVRLAEENAASGLREAVMAGTGSKIYVHQEAVVTNSDITRAQVVQGESASTFSVSVSFSAEGAAKMLRATKGHIGRPVAILIDGEVVSAPVVRDPITTAALIGGRYTRAEAEKIVAGVLGR